MRRGRGRSPRCRTGSHSSSPAMRRQSSESVPVGYASDVDISGRIDRDALTESYPSVPRNVENMRPVPDGLSLVRKLAAATVVGAVDSVSDREIGRRGLSCDDSLTSRVHDNGETNSLPVASTGKVLPPR